MKKPRIIKFVCFKCGEEHGTPFEGNCIIMNLKCCICEKTTMTVSAHKFGL